MVSGLSPLDDAVASRACSVNITVPAETFEESYFEELYGLLERERGHCGVFITLTEGDAAIKLQTDSIAISGSRRIQRELEAKGCVVEWIH